MTHDCDLGVTGVPAGGGGALPRRATSTKPPYSRFRALTSLLLAPQAGHGPTAQRHQPLPGCWHRAAAGGRSGQRRGARRRLILPFCHQVRTNLRHGLVCEDPGTRSMKSDCRARDSRMTQACAAASVLAEKWPRIPKMLWSRGLERTPTALLSFLQVFYFVKLLATPVEICCHIHTYACIIW